MYKKILGVFVMTLLVTPVAMTMASVERSLEEINISENISEGTNDF